MKKTILQTTTVKKLNGINLTSSMSMLYLRTFVDCLNSD